MKQIVRISYLLSLAFILFSFKASQPSTIDEVINAVKSGNAAQLARHFDNVVEVSLPDKGDTYSRSQAEMILRDFFNTYAVQSFKLIHQGDNAGSKYCIGRLDTRNGSFRINIFLKQKGDKQVLQKITVESN
jgi:Domain of unknown function (DUF4783)